MILIYENKEININIANTFWKRFKGFMNTTNIHEGIIFNHCSSIHTFFMKENIDVIMLDKNNTILYYYKDLPKNKVILPKKKVSKVIELPVNYFNFKINKKIIIK